jgi:hypothetical protein
MSLCKPCAQEALAPTAATAANPPVVCASCKFRFKTQELLDRHTRDWHTCARCAKQGRTDAVAVGDGFTRLCFDCSIQTTSTRDNADDSKRDSAQKE